MNSYHLQSRRPSLLIDLKRNRIRIHKATLHLLGDPDYIQFLVNPKDLSIVVRKSAKTDYLSQHIRWKQIGGKQCCDFYSLSLLRTLKTVYFSWSDNHAYRIYGVIYEKEHLAWFSMSQSVDIEEYSDVEQENS